MEGPFKLKPARSAANVIISLSIVSILAAGVLVALNWNVLLRDTVEFVQKRTILF